MSNFETENMDEQTSPKYFSNFGTIWYLAHTHTHTHSSYNKMINDPIIIMSCMFMYVCISTPNKCISI